VTGAEAIYLSGSQCLSIFHQDSPDSYTEIADIPANGGQTPSVKHFYERTGLLGRYSF
jgi:hypothetical protein